MPVSEVKDPDPLTLRLTTGAAVSAGASVSAGAGVPLGWADSSGGSGWNGRRTGCWRIRGKT